MILKFLIAKYSIPHHFFGGVDENPLFLHTGQVGLVTQVHLGDSPREASVTRAIFCSFNQNEE
jgi:hypothetical protein